MTEFLRVTSFLVVVLEPVLCPISCISPTLGNALELRFVIFLVRLAPVPDSVRDEF